MKKTKLIEIWTIPNTIKIGRDPASSFALIFQDQDGNKYVAAVACRTHNMTSIQKALRRLHPVDFKLEEKT